MPFALVLLAGCSTFFSEVGGGGGVVCTGLDSGRAAAAFAERLRKQEFHVSQAASNSTWSISFVKGSVSGTAVFSPHEGGGCIPDGYSYSFAVEDPASTWRSRRCANAVADAFKEKKNGQPDGVR